MPKAYSFSTTANRLSPKARATDAKKAVASLALVRAEATANLEIMLARCLADVSPLLPHDHPDTTLGHLCATMDALRVLVDASEIVGSPQGDDDWLAEVTLDKWHAAVDMVAAARPTTAAGLKVKAAAMALSVRTDARLDTWGGHEGAMDKPREVALLSLLQDIAVMTESATLATPPAPLPAPTVPGDIPVEFAAMGVHYRAGDTVCVTIPKRGARGVARLGTAIGAYATRAGFLVVVREEDGTEHRQPAHAVWPA